MVSISSILPLFWGDILSIESSPHYANYIRVLEISACLQSHEFTESQLYFLQHKIETHHSVLAKLYSNVESGNQTLTPKQHSLIHIIDQIILHGPPRHSWCFRYESVNAPFKKIMRRNCNYANVPLSMVAYHQKLAGLNLRCFGESDFF